jgi:hypothetical protein
MMKDLKASSNSLLLKYQRIGKQIARIQRQAIHLCAYISKK